MPSKMVLDRLKSDRAVSGSVAENADSIAAKITARLRPHLAGGERMPDLALLLELLAREITTLGDAAQRADDAHEAELADDGGPRARRDESAAALRQVISDLRGSLASAYGDDALALLRLRDAPSNDPTVLVEQADAARLALADASRKLPKSRRKGTRVDRDDYAEEIATHVVELRRALGEVERERKEADVTLAAKVSALDAHDGTFGRNVPVIDALYRLAGEDTLADKLRINARRPGQLEEPTTPVPAGGDAPLV